MSLRHEIPNFRFDWQEVEHKGHVPAYKQAEEIGFSADVDAVRFARRVMQAGVCVVTSAAGAGKSTKLPQALAGASGVVAVWHVVPSRALAVDTHDYVSQQGVSSRLVVQPEDMCDKGVQVVHTYSACVVAMLLQEKVDVSQVVLYLDEAHESDAYTYVLQQLARTFGFAAVVYATATSGGARFREFAGAGKLACTTYSPEEIPSRWDVEDADRPWSVNDLDGHLIIFADDLRALQGLSGQYQTMGRSFFQLTSRTSVTEVRQAMQRMRDPHGCLAVFVCDYSYRSGFTFDCARILDLGRVVNVGVQDGRVVRDIRRPYAFEVYQTSARGGRVAGAACQYARPEFEPETVRVKLEGVECDAAAVLFRAFGYNPDVHAVKSAMATHDVPKDLAEALRSAMPLVLQCKRAGDAVTVVGSERPVTPASEEANVTAPASPARTETSIQEASDLPGLSELDAALGAVCPTEVDLKVGRMYDYVHPDASAHLGGCRDFPSGVRDVDDDLHKGADFNDPQVRTCAVSLLLLRANATSCELLGMLAALREQQFEGQLFANPNLRKWCTATRERVNDLKADIKSDLRAARAVAGREGGFEVLPVDQEVVDDHKKLYCDAVRALLRAPDRRTMRKALQDASGTRAACTEDMMRRAGVWTGTRAHREGLAVYHEKYKVQVNDDGSVAASLRYRPSNRLAELKDTVRGPRGQIAWQGGAAD